MANSYKKVMTTVTSTGDSAAIYTVPTATTTLVKTAWAYNDSGGSASITLKINSTALNYISLNDLYWEYESYYQALKKKPANMPLNS